MKNCKLAFESSFTIEPISKYFTKVCNKYGIEPSLYFGPYNSYHQDALNDESELYAFKPDVVVLAVRLEEAMPDFVYGFNPDRDYQIEIKGVISSIEIVISALKKNSEAAVLVHNFELPRRKSLGVFDLQISNGQRATIWKLNAELSVIARKFRDVYVFDVEDLEATVGKNNWTDDRMWAIAKMPLSRTALEALSEEYVKYLIPVLRMTKKCLVLDLDNTLWGGIVGEDGYNGIKMDDNYPGIAYREFQRVILDLYKKGTILAINSKNNYDDAIEVIKNHPDMLLRENHFASTRINWNDKASNIRQIAAEINIGLDSMVFLDDNPAEREMIRQHVPEVLVPELPANPLKYASFLAELPVFENLNITTEDRERGEMYAAQVKRSVFENTTSSMDEFLSGLQMKLVIGKVDDFSTPRVAQLTQKTNQFNLTTKRYTEEEISKFAKSDDYITLYAQLIDRFGDNGITGTVIIKKNGDEWQIDTFLLSCRVMFRTVEDAIMAYMLEIARCSKVRSITGEYIPTKKNLPVKDLYRRLNFSLVAEKGESSLWHMDVNEARLKTPAWFDVQVKV